MDFRYKALIAIILLVSFSVISFATFGGNKMMTMVGLIAGGEYMQSVGAMHGSGPMHGSGQMHGANGEGHDEINMPGLKGENATAQESAELAVMFKNFDKITRKVENLPNGIRTITSSTDEEVMANLTSHVVGMIGRVENLDDPKIFIQSPTLDIFFMRGEKIDSKIDVNDNGIVVIQTSEDRELVKALQVHAAEVSDMADRGMQAVHESMMKRMTK